MKISPGKWKGLQAVSNARGVIAALAIDQRSALRSLFAKSAGIEPANVPRAWIEQYKEAVSRILTPFASAILLDPEYGLPAARRRAKNAGLLLAYEQTGYDKSVPGRLPRLLENWNVARLIVEGADCIKALLYYSPFSAAHINAEKQEWVARIGAECVSADVPFFLELVSYDDCMDEKSIEFARRKPQVVIHSVEEFSRSQYAVDVLKIGMPVNMAFVEGPHSDATRSAYTREEAKAHFSAAAAAAGKPFVYLSEGVSNEVFNDGLSLATEAGANFSGVLCGRATWKDGAPIFVSQGLRAAEDWLSTQGIKNIQGVNARLAGAKGWFEFYGAASAAVLQN